MHTSTLLAAALLGLLASGSLQAQQGESLYQRDEAKPDRTHQNAAPQAERATPRYGTKGDLIGEEKRRLPYRRAESDRPRDR